MKPLGIELTDIGDDHIELVMPITDAARQPLGMLHGGVSMVLVESAGSIHAAWGIDISKIIPVGIEISGSHLRSAKDGTVKAVGKVIRRSRSMVVHQVDIYHVETDKLLSTARVTNYYKKVSEESR
jgi:1,4-dihydroxy-2-naphthoyl-CoA hydrolase